MIEAGDSQVILEWSKNLLENHYLNIAIFVCGIGSGICSGIAKRFKDPAKVNVIYKL